MEPQKAEEKLTPQILCSTCNKYVSLANVSRHEKTEKHILKKAIHGQNLSSLSPHQYQEESSKKNLQKRVERVE